MKSARNVISFQIVMLTAMPSAISACGICAFAAADRYLPFIHFWCLAISVAFTAVSVAIKYSKLPVYFPSPLFAVAMGFIAFFFGVGMLGPLLFAIPALGIVIGVGHLARHGMLGGSSIIRVPAIAFALAFGVLGGLSYFKSAHRSDADYLIEWKGKAGSRRVLQEMSKRGPDGMNGIRRVVREGDIYLVGQAAETLARTGEPATDVPLLIDALKRLRASEEHAGEYPSNEVEEALRKLTGLSLPNRTKPEKWEKAWLAKK